MGDAEARVRVQQLQRQAEAAEEQEEAEEDEQAEALDQSFDEPSGMLETCQIDLKRGNHLLKNRQREQTTLRLSAMGTSFNRKRKRREPRNW